MKSFMDDKDFLISTTTGEELFHTYAEGMPIVDYHCHISPREIFEDKRYDTITDVWLGGDHYKWRLMRANGVDEAYVTGDADPREKFQKWAETLERCIGNPVYQWSHLELKRFFGYEGALNGRTAQEVWDLANKRLAEPDMSCRGLIRQSDVRLICTTDDPADSLEWHAKIAADPTFDVKVVPAMRPDHALGIEKPGFGDYVTSLAKVCGREVETFEDFKSALSRRFDFFATMGCKAADHALDYVMNVDATPEEVEAIFEARVAGKPVSEQDILKYKTAFMRFAAGEYVRLGWVMQLHYGCKRDNNTKMFKRLGPDTGFDCISNHTPADQLADFLDGLMQAGGLPKTILYSLNPNDNAVIDTIMGCFQEGPAVGKVQHGSAWWFNDSEDGMRAQLSTLANEGVLGNFVGMLTDSRSFLSYPRHEYFRRVLCGLMGEWVERGMYPDDREALGRMVRDISYNNAVRYFGFPLDEE
ncbi:MAG: glucuronate isomerase [Atopobiaceae bacterium]|jgi:glucuronate isomerase|nr:glucuronate isomerase [Atopobiaceae bacterium]MCH4179845.1 glucuronate isomerase [Atopobiaceae bacterium]MCH4213596.1 glucuronate isomerase [Atopobiaceae bacterium]MCH4229601.1 glucuronate isomerase [Atopobiaceae bacterium]MCI1259155.1 glucuronate isomerase [Atopobiaceae bacterium]